jgi:putative FmdB family regulatory protein
MPIYEYQRPDGTTFEVIQSFKDEPLSRDPVTGVPVRRVLHAPAVHFKGSGFYNTDYGTRKRQREAASESNEASADSTASDGAASEGAGAGAAAGEQAAASAKDSPGDGAAKSGGRIKPTPTSDRASGARSDRASGERRDGRSGRQGASATGAKGERGDGPRKGMARFTAGAGKRPRRTSRAPLAA